MKKRWKDVILTVAAVVLLAGFAYLVTAPAPDVEILDGYMESSEDDLSFLLD